MSYLQPESLFGGVHLNLTLDHLQSHLRGSDAERAAQIKTVRPLQAADGTVMSVQASDFHCCWPRDRAGPYQTVEIAVDQEVPAFSEYLQIDPFFSGKARFNLYQDVPVEIVVAEINQRGGLAA